MNFLFIIVKNPLSLNNLNNQIHRYHVKDFIFNHLYLINHSRQENFF